jgi:hypothetical protein
MSLSMHLTTAPLVLALAVATVSPANAQNDVNAPALVGELKVIVERAKRDRTADRRFIRELQDFIAKHDRSATRTVNRAYRTVINESFRDGNYTNQPTWTPVSGTFRVDGRYGLVAKPPASSTGSSNGQNKKNQLAQALLGALLSQGKSNNSSSAADQVPVARIETRGHIENGFELTTNISGIADGGVLRLSVVRDSPDVGYRIVVDQTARAPIVIQRVTQREALTVARYTGTLSGDNDGTHQITWSRDLNGSMRVTHNSRAVITHVDQRIDGTLGRLVIEAVGAEVGIRSIKLSTPG